MDLRIRLPGPSQHRNGATHTRLSGSRVVRLRNIGEDTNVASLKRTAARESGIATEDQIWSLHDPDSYNSRLEDLLKDLNSNPNSAEDHVLRSYNLRCDRPYTFVVKLQITYYFTLKILTNTFVSQRKVPPGLNLLIVV